MMHGELFARLKPKTWIWFEACWLAKDEEDIAEWLFRKYRAAIAIRRGGTALSREDLRALSKAYPSVLREVEMRSIEDLQMRRRHLERVLSRKEKAYEWMWLYAGYHCALAELLRGKQKPTDAPDDAWWVKAQKPKNGRLHLEAIDWVSNFFDIPKHRMNELFPLERELEKND